MPKGIPDIQHKSLYDILDSLKTEDDCREFLEERRWNGTVICVGCGGLRIRHKRTRNTFKCSDCKKEFSVKVGTIFEKTKVPFRKWFKIIKDFVDSRNGLTSCQISRSINVPHCTAWFMGQRIRIAMEEKNLILDGIVEADETQLGPDIDQDQRLSSRIRRIEDRQEELYGKSSNNIANKKWRTNKRKGIKASPKGRPPGSKNIKRRRRIAAEYQHKTFVAGMVSRNGQAILKKIGRTSNVVRKAVMHPLLKKYINSNATLITDGHKSYLGLGEHFHAYRVIIKIIQRKGRKPIRVFTNGYIHVNNCEGVWKRLKKAHKNYVHYSYKHADKYLNECAFLYNRCHKSTLEIFLDLLDSALKTRIKYQDLIQWNPEDAYTDLDDVSR